MFSHCQGGIQSVWGHISEGGGSLIIYCQEAPLLPGIVVSRLTACRPFETQITDSQRKQA